MPSSSGLSLCALVALIGAGCSRQSTQCESAADCDSGSVCLFEACRTLCADAFACAAEELCYQGGCLPQDLPCARGGACPDGFVCRGDRCRALCNGDGDCPLGDEACVDGVCEPVPDPSCHTTADCDVRGPCLDPDSSRCRGGKCVYRNLSVGTACDDANPCTPSTTCDDRGQCVGSSISCNEAPESICVEPGLYRSFVDVGVCNTFTGACEYPYRDFACTDCATTCLVACASLTCDASNGGCQSAGICVPTPPPGCDYDLADPGTTCDRPGDPQGSLRGVCNAGVCIECLSAAQCLTPPVGPAECFIPTCTGGTCSYPVQPQTQCAPPACADGLLTNPRVCGANGSCPDAGTQSCGGYACNETGTACKTACAGNEDCIGPATCTVPTCAAPCGDPCSAPSCHSHAGSCGSADSCGHVFGDHCDNGCPDHCGVAACHNHTGSCGSVDECGHTFGSRCDGGCPAHCSDNACHDHSGSCGEHDECDHQMGSRCDNGCPDHCSDNSCHNHTGSCGSTDECGHVFGSRCDGGCGFRCTPECHDHYGDCGRVDSCDHQFGNHCDIGCPDYCGVDGCHNHVSTCGDPDECGHVFSDACDSGCSFDPCSWTCGYCGDGVCCWELSEDGCTCSQDCGYCIP